ncbi:ferredoxin [Desulfocucumis palustris]|uniref:Ferredoxin n=2 Tax=Desulfocucumis palustris TaxID=1898651 RepID=A0A2L2XI46_9FIRM|nr:ferredoxin [Desulfocucumis palustris]
MFDFNPCHKYNLHSVKLTRLKENIMSRSKVAVLKTSPSSVLEDYGKLMRLADYKKHLSPDSDTVIKLNLSWTKYFPACSSQPWQLEGVVKTLLEDGCRKESLWPVENKTVVTNPVKGAVNNKWMPVLNRYGLGFTPLPDVEWVVFKPKAKLLMLDKIFPEGIEVPKMFLGKNVLHLPTVKTHGHSTTTGAIKNSFGGLLKEVRHYCHKYMHEVLVDLMLLQREIHEGIFAVMDGTVAGDGAGPRTMIPYVKDYILASGDSVAIDAVAAKMMGMDPMSIPYLRMCHDRKLGCANPGEIEIVGEDISNVNFGFEAKKSFVIWGDQMIRKGFLRPFEKILLHSPLMVWAPFASNVYHDFFWYPTVGGNRIKAFARTGWGKLFEKY